MTLAFLILGKQSVDKPASKPRSYIWLKTTTHRLSGVMLQLQLKSDPRWEKKPEEKGWICVSLTLCLFDFFVQKTDPWEKKTLGNGGAVGWAGEEPESKKISKEFSDSERRLKISPHSQ